MVRELRFEDANPRLVTVEGYACHGCGRVHAGEDRARLCCATSLPCECGGRKPKHYTMCDNCRWRQEQEKWLALEFAAWDGAFPVGEYHDDVFHWDEESLAIAIEHRNNSEDLTYEMVVDFCDAHRVCMCAREPLPTFEIENFLCDYISDECDMTREQAERIDAAVNAILAAEKLPESWTHAKKRIDPRSIAEALGVYVPSAKGGAT